MDTERLSEEGTRGWPAVPSSTLRASPATRGMTLIELIVTVAVLATLMSFAAPSFSELAARVEQSETYNRLVRDLRYARDEAIKGTRLVTVCARGTATSCGDDWGDGWHVYVESAGGTDGTIDGGETPLRSFASSDASRRLTAAAIVRPAPLATRSALSFDSRGRADWTLGTFAICDTRGAEKALSLIVNGAGGLRRGGESDGEPPVALDAFGDPLECPS